MHDMDIAHSGAYSLYIEGIRRTDRLCGELWAAVQNEPEYKDNTTLFILPDFGRDADYDAGGNGFQHHRTGDAASRTTWMMALGSGVREKVIMRTHAIHRPRPESRRDHGLFAAAGAGKTDQGIAISRMQPLHLEPELSTRRRRAS